MHRARLSSIFRGADPRVCIAFWLFGLINNILYVLILSAALDLVGPSVPKSVVLLCDVVPSFIAKLVLPYIIQRVPYSVRVCLFVLLSTWGMLLVALGGGISTPPSIQPRASIWNAVPRPDSSVISTKMAGVILASLSSGAGELSFLGLTHFYGPFALAAWGSGTGGAGLLGAGMYALFTVAFGFSSERTLLVSSGLPLVMLVAFFGILPKGPLRRRQITPKLPSSHAGEDDASEHDPMLPSLQDQEDAEDGLLAQSPGAKASIARSPTEGSWLQSFTQNLRRSRSLFIPYMLPLLMVYVSEYTINTALFPLLLFSLHTTPFVHLRSIYPTYAFLYQSTVFISRSSTPFLRIQNIYTPSLLQCLNFVILLAHCIVPFIPSIWIVFVIVLWEGLLGGGVYVNCFAKIQDEVGRGEDEQGDREYALSAVSVSDSGGIMIAGFIGMWLEPGLCQYMVSKGRDLCREV